MTPCCEEGLPSSTQSSSATPDYRGLRLGSTDSSSRSSSRSLFLVSLVPDGTDPDPRTGLASTDAALWKLSTWLVHSDVIPFPSSLRKQALVLQRWLLDKRVPARVRMRFAHEGWRGRDGTCVLWQISAAAV